MTPFSYHDRPVLIKQLAGDPFDIVIIGGGITGAGIALDAASRGLKAALVEKVDFAYGTSSRSTKLIHGGLRYLKQLEFGLVKEVGSERAVVHNLAPHLVVPEKMLLPLSEKKGLGYWLTSIGLKVYDLLAGVKAEDQRRMLTKAQTLRYEPLLKKDDIKGGAIYAEYRTDDARLTMEIIKTAVNHGAVILNYVRVTDFIYTNEQVSGVKVKDGLSGEIFSIQAKTVVSAAGPWVDELREINKSKSGKRLHLTKGVHIVLPHHKLPVKQAIYFDMDDGRMIFAIPRGRITYVGTTDTNYEGDKDHVTATPDDATYLIQGVNTTFPSVGLSVADIESSWAGLRPLIHEDGKSASELSRKDEIFESPTGLISIAGGKLTGYRKMAERVVNLVIKNNFEERKLKPCQTQKLRLSEHSFSGARQVRDFVRDLQHKLVPHKLPPHTAAYLVENYGQEAETIFKRFETQATSQAADLALLKAELWHCFHFEMVCTLSDFLIRRTGLTYFDLGRVLQWKETIARECQVYFKWDDILLAEQLDQLDEFIASLKSFR
jgi:glycerol-3-phosphate dehydrogenase